MRNFRDLRVYREGLGLNADLRKLAKSFPREERFALTEQLHRSADSIVLNIAEGAGNRSDREFARFLEIAIRSGQEVMACLDIALASGLLPLNEHTSMCDRVDKVIAMMARFQQTLRR